MRKTASGDDSYVLEDGANIAVIGGGPAGSFFSIFALKMAKMIGKELNVTIFEPKDFTRQGPPGCNMCGGVISELLVQTLAVEGINFPDSVVRKGINSYKLHTSCGSTYISTPSLEKTIATVYRGSGPKGMVSKGKQSLDKFLLDQAIEQGAVHKPVRIDRLEYQNHKPVLFAQDRQVLTADLVVGAFGVNSRTTQLFEDIGFGYRKPRTIGTAVAEITLDDPAISEALGDSIHLFLLPTKELKFAAVIPKGGYVTICLLGKNLNATLLKEFLNNPIVKNVLPESITQNLGCRCFPKMNTSAAKKPFADRVVICGDAGSTRLFKDGIGAAYFMGKAAATTAVFQGVSKAHFKRDYYPAYKSLIVDNYFGRFMFAVTEVYRKYKIFTKGMLGTVEKEQKDTNSRKVLSNILWDMFTGSERYKKVFLRAMNVGMLLDQCSIMAMSLVRRKK